MKFVLEIELGNSAMETYNDVAGALKSVAKRLQNYDGKLARMVKGIRDENGNTVGSWKFDDE